MNIFLKTGQIIFKIFAIFLILLALLLEYLSQIHRISKEKSKDYSDRIIKSTNIHPRLKHYGY